MADMMEFPPTFLESIKKYSFKDKEEVYTNGAELVPSFRAIQAWDYYMDKFRSALYHSDNDLHVFGHYCKKILKDMGEIG